MPSLFLASKISLRSLWFSSVMATASSSVRNLYEQMIAADARMKSVKLYYDVDPV